MTNQGKVNEFRAIMIEEIKMNVKSIHTKLYGELADDESCYVLYFSDVTKREISVVLYDDYQNCHNKVILEKIVITENDVYMTGYLDDTGDSVEEIYFDLLNTDLIATIADVLWNKNYKL